MRGHVATGGPSVLAFECGARERKPQGATDSLFHLYTQSDGVKAITNVHNIMAASLCTTLLCTIQLCTIQLCTILVRYNYVLYYYYVLYHFVRYHYVLY